MRKFLLKISKVFLSAIGNTAICCGALNICILNLYEKFKLETDVNNDRPNRKQKNTARTMFKQMQTQAQILKVHLFHN